VLFVYLYDEKDFRSKWLLDDDDDDNIASIGTSVCVRLLTVTFNRESQRLGAEKVAQIIQLRVDGCYYDIACDAGPQRRVDIKVAVALENCW